MEGSKVNLNQYFLKEFEIMLVTELKRYQVLTTLQEEMTETVLQIVKVFILRAIIMTLKTISLLQRSILVLEKGQ